MICAWEQCIQLIPQRMRKELEKLSTDNIQEIRIRTGRRAEIVQNRTSFFLSHEISEEDIQYVINSASKYSPWYATGFSKGYISVRGGHRVGICGDVVLKDGVVTTIRYVTSLCIRIARDIYGVSHELYEEKGNVLILGCPGAGKTTLLRDLIRMISDKGKEEIGVVDERGELFPQWEGRFAFSPGYRTDVLSACPKAEGIEMLLRTMGPACIAVDEITAQRDCDALIRAGWCGIRLIATAHASSLTDLRTRTVYKPIVDAGLFDTVVVLHRDRSWHVERMK